MPGRDELLKQLKDLNERIDLLREDLPSSDVWRPEKNQRLDEILRQEISEDQQRIDELLRQEADVARQLGEPTRLDRDARLKVEDVHNFETFPEVPETEPAEPVDEPINAWELEDAGAPAVDGGDAMRPDSVIPDLGQKAPKGPPSDEAEAAIDGAHDQLPSLVGKDVVPMGGGFSDEEIVPPPSLRPMTIDDLKNFETFPEIPEEEQEELDGIDDIASRSSGGIRSVLFAVPVAVALGVLAFLAASRLGVPEVASIATGPVVTMTATASSAPSAQGSARGVQSYEYTVSPLRISLNGVFANLAVTMNTSAVNLPYRTDEVMTFTWTIDAGSCAKVTKGDLGPDHASVDFFNATDARGRRARCPGGPDYPISVKLVMKDRWGAEYVREWSGAMKDGGDVMVGEQIKVHHEGP